MDIERDRVAGHLQELHEIILSISVIARTVQQINESAGFSKNSFSEYHVYGLNGAVLHLSQMASSNIELIEAILSDMMHV
ncbi:hypothetical protein NR756_04845 [Alloalcanivorax xenomutans]|uniref:hypothetical protein n=1 Tax=Alloalcanivorax xenomutans TaxID=1094342 RepID=UPI000E28A041